jgi:hypothetical protein
VGVLNFPPPSPAGAAGVQVLRIEFENHAPVTAAVAKPQPAAKEKTP